MCHVQLMAPLAATGSLSRGGVRSAVAQRSASGLLGYSRYEPQPDRQLHLGRRGPDPRHLQARQVPGRDAAAHGAPAARLRAVAYKGEGAESPGHLQEQDREPGSPASARLGIRLLQHLALRLREAARRRPPYRREPAQLHRGVQPQHARSAREVRLRQHHRQARRVGSPVPRSCNGSPIRG